MKTTIDIESFDVESQTMMPLHDYQKTMLQQIEGGFKFGELTTMTAGTGKSHFAQMYLQNFYNIFGSNQPQKIKPFKNVTHADVDGVPWHTVSCNDEVSAWVRIQNKEYWYEHPKTSFLYSGMFDVHDKVYTLMRVGFSA